MDSLGWGEIIVAMALRFAPVWLGIGAVFIVSIRLRRRLGLYGKLFDSGSGMVGLGIVLFWVFTALFADIIITHDPLGQVSGMKNALPGTLMPDGTNPYLLGGDNLARDVFSRMVMGARRVVASPVCAAVEAAENS